MDHMNERIDVSDRGFLLGDGLFETIKIVDNKAEFLNQHLERLVAGAGKLEIPVSIQQIKNQLDALVSNNHFQPAVARVTLTRGSGSRGLNPPADPKPNLIITVSEYQLQPERPLTLFISSTRRNEFSPTSQLKTLSYTDNVLARMEALKHGADEAVLLNTQGFVACAAAGNIFIEKDGVFITPPLSEGVLPGIMRAQILMKPGAEERRLTVEDLKSADALYVTNVLIGMKRAILK